MKFIDGNTIYSLADYKQLVEIAKHSLFDLSNDRVTVPQRIHINTNVLNATYLFMPVFSERLNRVACKYVGVCEQNKKLGIPSINGVLTLADAKTGIVEFMFDAAALTAVRTAAISAASIDILSKKESQTISVFGSSTQAYTQIVAACDIRDIKKVYIYYRTKSKAEELCSNLKDKIKVEIQLTDSLSYLEESDIIIAATNTKTPLFYLKDVKLKQGVHISAIGSFKKDMQEIDEKIYEKFAVFTDHKESCIKESADITVPLSKGLINKKDITEMGNLSEDTAASYRNKNTIFKSVGNAAFDLYTADHISKLIKA